MSSSPEISRLIHLFRSENDLTAMEMLIEKMEPLIKKYARKSFFIEYEDSRQEMILSIIEAVCKIGYYEDEKSCLLYIKNSVIHKYCELCKKNINQPIFDEFNENIVYEDSLNDLDTIIDLEQFLKNKSITKKQIMKLILYDELGDTQIAKMLNVSRQYVNRVKKEIIAEYTK